MKVKSEISIPIQLLVFAQKNRVIPELQLYIFLLMSSSGTLKKGSARYKWIRDKYIKSTKTFNSCLSRLIRMNWISFNQKSKVIYINSMNRILYGLGDYNPLRVKFNLCYLNYFRVFVFAAIVSEKLYRISRGIKYGEKKGKYAELKRWNSRNHITGFFPNYIGISTDTIMKLTGLSAGTVVNLKKASTKHKLLKIRNQFAFTEIKSTDRLLFQRAYPSYVGRIKIINGRVAIQLHDQIDSNLKIVSISRKQAFQRVEYQNHKKWVKN